MFVLFCFVFFIFFSFLFFIFISFPFSFLFFPLFTKILPIIFKSVLFLWNSTHFYYHCLCQSRNSFQKQKTDITVMRLSLYILSLLSLIYLKESSIVVQATFFTISKSRWKFIKTEMFNAKSFFYKNLMPNVKCQIFYIEIECQIFNAKSFLIQINGKCLMPNPVYQTYDLQVNSLEVKFLNKSELICLHTVKSFQV